jgi:uncharacterized Zn finger protein (UPF0148 family)
MPFTNKHCDAQPHFKDQPTGEVVCAECWETAMAVEDIHHKPSCSQFDVMERSTWEEHSLEEILAEEYSGKELQQVIEAHHDELDVDELPCDCADGVEVDCSLQPRAHADD